MNITNNEDHASSKIKSTDFKKNSSFNNSSNFGNETNNSNSNKGKLILKNISKNKNEEDILRFAFSLTKVYPLSCESYDEQIGAWMLNFKYNIG